MPVNRFGNVEAQAPAIREGLLAMRELKSWFEENQHLVLRL